MSPCESCWKFVLEETQAKARAKVFSFSEHSEDDIEVNEKPHTVSSSSNSTVHIIQVTQNPIDAVISATDFQQRKKIRADIDVLTKNRATIEE